MNSLPRSIGRRRAIALADSRWWDGRPAREVAKFQLFTRELCMPFPVFHASLEETLGRPVMIHEFGFAYDQLVLELLGERDAPDLDEVLALVPEDKRLVLTLDD